MKLEHIHSDNRGCIYSVTEKPLSSPEVSFLSTKKGIARGGCIHYKNYEHLCVIEGTIEYYFRLPNETEISNVILSTGQTISIPPATPHYLISLTDSIVIEWGCDLDEKKEKYEPFRRIVNEINES